MNHLLFELEVKDRLADLYHAVDPNNALGFLSTLLRFAFPVSVTCYCDQFQFCHIVAPVDVDDRLATLAWSVCGRVCVCGHYSLLCECLCVCVGWFCNVTRTQLVRSWADACIVVKTEVVYMPLVRWCKQTTIFIIRYMPRLTLLPSLYKMCLFQSNRVTAI